MDITEALLLLENISNTPIYYITPGITDRGIQYDYISTIHLGKTPLSITTTSGATLFIKDTFSNPDDALTALNIHFQRTIDNAKKRLKEGI